MPRSMSRLMSSGFRLTCNLSPLLMTKLGFWFLICSIEMRIISHFLTSYRLLCSLSYLFPFRSFL